MDNIVVIIKYSQQDIQDYKRDLLVISYNDYESMLKQIIKDNAKQNLETILVNFDYNNFIKWSNGKDSPELRAKWANEFYKNNNFIL